MRARTELYQGGWRGLSRQAMSMAAKPRSGLPLALCRKAYRFWTVASFGFIDRQGAG